MKQVCQNIDTYLKLSLVGLEFGVMINETEISKTNEWPEIKVNIAKLLSLLSNDIVAPI